MSDLLRDSALGYVVRFFTRNKVLNFPEECPKFVCPAQYNHSTYDEKNAPPTESCQKLVENEQETSLGSGQESGATIPPALTVPEPALIPGTPDSARSTLDEKDSVSGNSTGGDKENINLEDGVRSCLRPDTNADLRKITDRQGLERVFSAATIPRGPCRPVIPTMLEDGTILVEWYTTTDPSNPMNWSAKKKIFVATQINLYTLVVYMGSAIYTASTPNVMRIFDVPVSVASLGLALYVFGYGLGPLLFSPLSEIAEIGRLPPYILTFVIFTILCIPTSVVNNIPGLLILRFLQGFFGSPCLATGGVCCFLLSFPLFF